MNLTTKNTLITGRGSSAIYVALKALGLEDAGVMVPVNVCEVVVATIIASGNNPVYADVDPSSGNSELEHFQNSFIKQVRAVIAVPNFGTPINMHAIANWCRMNNLFLIEDLCNSLGARYDGFEFGQYGTMAVYSFGYAKIIELGKGGALVVNAEEYAKKAQEIYEALPLYNESHLELEESFNVALRALRTDPTKHKPKQYNELYQSFAKCLIFKLCESERRDVLAKVEQHALYDNLKHRAKIASIYRGLESSWLEHRANVDGEIYWRYSLLAKNNSVRDLIVYSLRNNGFLVSTWYPNVAMFFSEDVSRGDYPGADIFEARVLNLFVDHRVNEKTAQKTVELIQSMA